MSAGPPLPVDLWDSLSPEARALILTLQAEAAELRAKVRAPQQQVHDLQERLNQNSTSSSRPPSTDLSTVKRRPPRPVSGRKPGGQPGHERGRPLPHPITLSSQAHAVPPVRPGPCRPRSSAAAPSGIGAAATPARGDRVPTPPSPVSRLRPLHVRLAARGRSYWGARTPSQARPRPNDWGLSR